MSHSNLVICRARLGSNALALAWLGRAQAHKNLEPGPGPWLRLGWAGLGLKPGLQSKEMIIFASLDNSPNDNTITSTLDALVILTMPHAAAT